MSCFVVLVWEEIIIFIPVNVVESLTDNSLFQCSIGPPVHLLQGDPVHHIQTVRVVRPNRLPCQLWRSSRSLHGRFHSQYCGDHLLPDHSIMLQSDHAEEAEGVNDPQETDIHRSEA